jgi:hypothetical protein
MITFPKANGSPAEATNQTADKLPSIVPEKSDNTKAALQRLLEELEAQEEVEKG